MATSIQPFTSSCGRWHAWQGTAHVLLSDEATGQLTYYSAVDEAINSLWLAGHREAARELNKHKDLL